MTQMLYLRLEGIDGEEPIGDDSQDAIAILNYTHSLGRALAPHRHSVGAEASMRRSMAGHSPFVVEKAFDKTSPRLFAAAAHGVTIKNAVIYSCTQEITSLTKATKPVPFLSIILTDALITDFSYEYVDNWQLERIEFHYASIGWHVQWKDPESGDSETIEPVGWDGAENKIVEISIPSAVEWSTGLL